MSLVTTPPSRRSVKASIFLAAMLLAAGAQAKTTGVVEDPVLQSGPCYEALIDKNAATPTTAPNRELGSACEAEHGDVAKAWARVIRLWGSDSADVPDYDSYRRADAPIESTVPRWLALVGLLLTYAVLGTPMRAAAGLSRVAWVFPRNPASPSHQDEQDGVGELTPSCLAGAAPGPASASGSVVEVVVCLVLRGSIAVVLIALMSLPGLTAAFGIALMAWLLLGHRIAPTRRWPSPGSGAAGALATHLAGAINDGLGAAAGLVAVALFVQHDIALLAVGLALALVASLGAVIAGRRALRSTRLAAAAGAALLAAAIGEIVLLTPPVAAWVGGSSWATGIVLLVLAALTSASGWRADPPRVSPAD